MGLDVNFKCLLESKGMKVQAEVLIYYSDTTQGMQVECKDYDAS